MKNATPRAEVPESTPAPSPRAVIVMGVCGTGKSTVGQALAARQGWTYADADDFHPAANVEKMRAGTPLNDADRAPWLDLLRSHLEERLNQGRSAVLACSALRVRYRDVLRGGVDTPDPRVRFVHLAGSRELLADRLDRPGHYMPASLLDSQLATLEAPSANEGLTLDVSLAPEDLVERIAAWLDT